MFVQLTDRQLAQIQDEGLEIISLKNTEEEIFLNFEQGLKELQQVQAKQIKTQSLEEFL